MKKLLFVIAIASSAFLVSCGSTSKRLIRNLAEIFDKFRLRYKISIKRRYPLRKDLFLIRVYRDSLEKYYEFIGFSNKYKLKKLKKILGNKWGRQDLNLRGEVPNLEY